MGNSRFYDWHGEKWSIKQLSEEYNIHTATITNRLNRGLTLEEALLTPELGFERKKKEKKKRKKMKTYADYLKDSVRRGDLTKKERRIGLRTFNRMK